MQQKYRLTSRLVIAGIAFCVQFAYAAEDSGKKSFEDGLKTSVYSLVESEKQRDREYGKEGKEYEIESDDYMEWHDIEDGTHVTMVPEPATYVMLLAGIAVLLLAARRKQISKVS